MLTVTNLTKTFAASSGKVTAVNDISLEIENGTLAAIVGKSGSGKSTLLTLLGGLDRPTSGSVKVDDQDISKMSDHKLISYRRQKVGFVFQHYNLIPNLTALENVMLPMEYAGKSRAEQQSRASQLLDEVGISGDKQARKPARLSGGEQQRVSIARALANKPSLILADEPTGNLDSTTSKKVIELLKKLSKQENTTIVVVTHDLNITKEVDVTFQVRDGQLIQKGKHVEELLH